VRLPHVYHAATNIYQEKQRLLAINLEPRFQAALVKQKSPENSLHTPPSVSIHFVHLGGGARPAEWALASNIIWPSLSVAIPAKRNMQPCGLSANTTFRFQRQAKPSHQHPVTQITKLRVAHTKRLAISTQRHV